MGITFNALSEAVGTEVLGIGLADKIDDATFRKIKRTFHERGMERAELQDRDRKKIPPVSPRSIPCSMLYDIKF